VGRNCKYIVDYFPHDTDASDGRTLTIIQTKYGNDGYAFWFKLLQLLGRTEGHFFDFTTPADWEFLLAKMHFTSAEKALEILNTLATLGAIDKRLFEAKIIWSDNFITRISDAYSRRKEKLPVKPKLPISAGGNSKSADINAKDVVRSAQRKGKEIKIEDTKVSYGEFRNVFLSTEDYNKLIVKFGEKTANTKIDELSEYIKAQPQKAAKYKDHYATILSWDRLDKKRKEEKGIDPRKPQRPKRFEGHQHIVAGTDEE
jgi:hypothetical protein